MTNRKVQDINAYREVSAIPKSDEFFYLLYDRLHMVLNRLNILTPNTYTLFLQSFPRKETIIFPRNRAVNLSYLGLYRQKELLNIPSADENDLRKAWDYLKKSSSGKGDIGKLYFHQLSTATAITEDQFSFYQKKKNEVKKEIEEGLELSDILFQFNGKLSDYFDLNKSTNAPTDWDKLISNQQAEYHILKAAFEDLWSYYYLSVPLIQLGEIDGIVHIIYHKHDHIQFEQKDDRSLKEVGRIIKAFSNEMEGLILDWDFVEKNVEKVSLLRRVLTTEFFQKISKQPILVQLGYPQYYKEYTKYIQKRIDLSDEAPERFKSIHRSTAVIATLLDSYAHNISAHSLITLTSWYQDLADYLTKATIRPKEHLSRYNALIDYHKTGRKDAMAFELHRLFEFLLQKGAFWSGITRKTNFSGKRENAFDVLWNDFVNNTLYLGTIANSEKVNKINIHISIYNEEEPKGQLTNIKRTKNIPLNALFATIDLNNPELDREVDTSERAYSLFARKGMHFCLLKEALQQIWLFFPGGVVGKHSFFTLIENEIRNVKHYKNERLKRIQRDGLNLHLSFHERPVNSRSPSNICEIYKVGVWLGHPIFLSGKLLLERIGELSGDIIDKYTFKPKLGGSHQDKICAAQLMTNDFDNVQEQDNELGKIYFPWVKAAGTIFDKKESNISEVREFETSLRRFKKIGKEEFEAISKAQLGEGYLKKYFHLWKGAFILNVRKEKNLELENPSRFKFVRLDKGSEERYIELKSRKNIVRILSTNVVINNEQEAYHQWLSIWQKNEGTHIIEFEEDGNTAAILLYKNGTLQFLHEDEAFEYIEENVEEYLGSGKQTISVAHNQKFSTDPRHFNYRSHGYLISQFTKGENISNLKNVEIENLYQLFEALITKVCIFDRRIHNKMCPTKEDIPGLDKKFYDYNQKLKLYRNELNIDFRNEVISDWEDVKERGFLNYHFLVLHLSFVEKMEDEYGEAYGEKGFERFVRTHILQGKSPEEIGDNFILIITTGRGRMEWWENIKNTPLARFTTFRSIESINAAISDATEIGDDIDIKINLAKILFGS